MTVHVLLGGAIGSGKSTAAGILAGLGAATISADEAGHRVLEPGGEAEAVVAARWPHAVKAGRIDRAELGRIVFSDPGALAELESVTHPAIRRRVLAKVAEVGPAAAVIVEVPLAREFLGPGWTKVVVDAPEATRRERLAARGMPPEEVSRRIAAQPTGEEWLAFADHVIDNGGDPGHLEAECVRVWSLLIGPGKPPAAG